MRTLLCCLLALCGFVVSACAESPKLPECVSLLQLLANPEKFNGVAVKVVGYFDMPSAKGIDSGLHGSDVLYLHREDFLASLRANGVAIETTADMIAKSKDYAGRYVIIMGVFDSTNHGYMGQYTGTIVDVMAVPWEVKVGEPAIQGAGK